MRTRRFLPALILSAAFVGISGCASTPPPVSDKVQAAYEAGKSLQTAAPIIRVAAVGDSTTEGSAPDFNHGITGPLSWPNSLPAGLGFVGGWAKGGASTQLIRDSASHVDADVLVVMAGTNDARFIPFQESDANLKTIVDKVGVKRVIVSTIAPHDPDPVVASAYNRQLEPFVRTQGWEYVDAWAGVRTDTNQYAPGLSQDGIHPSQEAVNIIAQAIAGAIKAPH
jgi:lysophospholipase L1-like esterase